MSAAAAVGRWGGMGGCSGVDGSSHLLSRPPSTLRAIEAASTAHLFLYPFPPALPHRRKPQFCLHCREAVSQFFLPI